MAKVMLSPEFRKSMDEALAEVERGDTIVFEDMEDILIIYHRQKCRKYRFGDYRIIYQIKKNQNGVLFPIIDHRKRI